MSKICGMPTQQGGTPCQLPVKNKGTRCHHHAKKRTALHGNTSASAGQQGDKTEEHGDHKTKKFEIPGYIQKDNAFQNSVFGSFLARIGQNLELAEIPGDGHCGYHSMIKILEADQNCRWQAEKKRIQEDIRIDMQHEEVVQHTELSKNINPHVFHLRGMVFRKICAQNYKALELFMDSNSFRLLLRKKDERKHDELMGVMKTVAQNHNDIVKSSVQEGKNYKVIKDIWMGITEIKVLEEIFGMHIITLEKKQNVVQELKDVVIPAFDARPESLEKTRYDKFCFLYNSGNHWQPICTAADNTGPKSQKFVFSMHDILLSLPPVTDNKGLKNKGVEQSEENKQAKDSTPPSQDVPQDDVKCQEKDQWSCSSCTFCNNSVMPICEICNNPRVPAEEWTCDACTMNNPGENEKCAACDRNKP